MTAPISNGPTTTRLHHYAGHYLFSGELHAKLSDAALCVPQKLHVIPPGPHSATARKPRNFNDPISIFETFSGELRAKLLCPSAAGPGCASRSTTPSEARRADGERAGYAVAGDQAGYLEVLRIRIGNRDPDR